MKIGIGCLVLALALSAAACGKLQKPVPLTVRQESMVTVEASDFKFAPNHFQTYQGTSIVFTVRNISGSKHNFTIKDPDGKVLQSTDVEPQKSVRVKVDFPHIGVYPFYCNRPFHRTMGMQGRVEVVAR
ncbi:MAG TPA: plastocyanin/azurin family copper-binding protein [Syntrophorhabdales bacterium]|nr:plastocyanin/azurin family copper-binding protein [Syntrophorhabdales bacterium]